MTGLLAKALFGIAALALLGALVELRTAWRFARLKRGRPGDAGRVEVEGTIESGGDTLEAPLSKTPCVLFSLVLSRQRKDFSGRSALLFVEQRPFVFVADATRMPVDPKKGDVVVTGLDAIDSLLTFLPQGVLGLLVTRFGHMAHVWAEDYVLRGRESCLPVGATVYALLQEGRLLTVSTKPLAALSRSARQRALQALLLAAPLVVVALLLSR